MTERKKTPSSIWVLSAALACIGAGQSTIFILVPQEIRSLGFNEFQVGLIFSISALAWIFFSPFWGRLSDRSKKKQRYSKAKNPKHKNFTSADAIT